MFFSNLIYDSQWMFRLPWKWYGFSLTTSTRFGEPVIAHVSAEYLDPKNPLDVTITGADIYSTTSLTRPWGTAPAAGGSYRIYASDCNGYPRFWTLEPDQSYNEQNKPKKMKIALHGKEHTDLQTWKLEPFKP